MFNYDVNLIEAALVARLSSILYMIVASQEYSYRLCLGGCGQRASTQVATDKDAGDYSMCRTS